MPRRRLRAGEGTSPIGSAAAGERAVAELSPFFSDLDHAWQSGKYVDGPRRRAAQSMRASGGHGVMVTRTVLDCH